MTIARGTGTPASGTEVYDQTDLDNAVGYAEEWANKAEDSLISTAAGGDGSTEYSSLHHAAKASASASAASSSASSASTAQTAAETAQTAAETAQTAAETAETNAAASASAASTSETNAAASEAAAAASYDSFDDRYLGVKSSAPTLDNDGNALVTGALYYLDTGAVGMKVYNGASWDGVNPDLVGDTTPQLGGDLDCNGNGITLQAGSSANLSVDFSGDTNTGFYNNDPDNIRFIGGGEEILNLSASGVTNANYVGISAASTGTGPTITATGYDGSIDLNLTAKNSGVVNIDGYKAVRHMDAGDTDIQVGDISLKVQATDVTETVHNAVEDTDLTWTNLPVGLYMLNAWIMGETTGGTGSGQLAEHLLTYSGITNYGITKNTLSSPWQFDSNGANLSQRLIEVTSGTNSLKIQLRYDQGFGSGSTAHHYADSWAFLRRIS